jgi:hypothetical protein
MPTDPFVHSLVARVAYPCVDAIGRAPDRYRRQLPPAQERLEIRKNRPGVTPICHSDQTFTTGSARIAG